ncbi:MAG: PAS domain S-box protein [Nitriliruptoraceae bacterium]
MGKFAVVTRTHERHPWLAGTVLYVVSAMLWIVVSDLWLFATDRGPRWSIAKGATFVMITATLLAAVLRAGHRRRVHAASQLAERQAEIALIGTSVSDVFYRFDLVPTPRFAYVSDAVERLVGYTPQDHYDDPDLGQKIIHPDDGQQLDNPTELTGVSRLRWRHRDGRTLWCEQNNQLLMRDGQPVAIVGVTRDVTADAMHQLQHDALDEFNHDVFVRQTPIDAALNTLVDSLVAGIDAASVTCTTSVRLANCTGHDYVSQASGNAQAAPEIAATTGATTVTIVPSAATPARDLMVELTKYVATRLDETHLALHRELHLERLRIALDATAAAVLVTDVDGTIEWVNRAFTDTTGYGPAEVIGNTPRILASGKQDAKFYEQLWETITAGKTFAGTVVDRRKDGTLYTASLTIDPIADHTGAIVGFVGVQRDITEELELREQLRQAELELFEERSAIEEDRATLVQTVSHELRTPLTIITGAAKTLSYTHPDDATRTKLLAALDRSTELVLDRLSVLLAATDQADQAPVHTTAGQLVGGALIGLRSRHDLSRVQIAGDQPWFGRARLAKALLLPLLDNALKYSPDGFAVRVVVEADRPALTITISDTGGGIPAVVLRQQTEPFHQGDSSSTRQHGGLGLGLYAAHRIAQRLDATIEFATGAAGTVVTVSIPRIDEDPGETRSLTASLPDPSTAHGRS